MSRVAGGTVREPEPKAVCHRLGLERLLSKEARAHGAGSRLPGHTGWRKYDAAPPIGGKPKEDFNDSSIYPVETLENARRRMRVRRLTYLR